MSYFDNPIANREQRMTEGTLARRINGAKLQIFTTVMNLEAVRRNPLNHDGVEYLRYLCGLNDYDRCSLTPEQKAPIGNFFEKACKMRRSFIDKYVEEAMPGFQEVQNNRKLVAKRQSQNGLTKSIKRSVPNRQLRVKPRRRRP